MIHEPVFLYVEDDPDCRAILQMLLVRVLGYKALYVFEDSSEFMERLKALPEKPDICFFDIHVKPYNGFEMLRMVREDATYKDTLVVAVTASMMHERVHMLREAGFDSMIPKPLDMEIFPDLLTRILNGEQTWNGM
ncbi:MAG TPA: response regulator [Aggregatilineales bacterium]|nr:response regulator [Aggregatilineales bacterium]